MQRQPILQQTCAQASTAAESAFRVQYPDRHRRDSRILALDEEAAGILADVATDHQWAGARFLVYEGSAPGSDSSTADANLRTIDGEPSTLSEEVATSDVVIMIATAAASPQAAELVGDACAARNKMSAAMIIDDDPASEAPLTALRPNAMVLVVLKDRSDIPDMLTALRA